MFIDTHTHLSNQDYDDVDLIVKNAVDNNVKYLIISCCSMDTIDEGIALADKYPNIFLSIGLHPSEIFKYDSNDLEYIENIVKNNKKVVAIGEIGLDYHYIENSSDKDLQKELFIKQLDMATRLSKPVVIHTREAVMDTLQILKENKVTKTGVFHCCPQNRELIKEGLKLGFYISFAGPITFKNSKNAEEMINLVPNDRILIETDSPYLAPEPVRGTRNTPANVKYIAQKIADVKGLTLEEVEKITFENTKNILYISKLCNLPRI